jgi:predicted AAA+ superfamily ATPase
MLKRDKYLILLNEEKNSNFIKVLTGIRRVGKSTLLNQFKETCQNDNIIEFDFNELNQCVYTYETLHDEIIKRTIENKTNVVILDEIQEIENFEKCIISLYSNKKYKYDIYITGSNSHMFSAELVTLFTGRTMEYVVFPFSFKEINEYIFQNTNAVKQYEYYLMHGGLGAIVDSYLKSDRCYKILENVFNTILKKDLVDRYNIRNTDGFEKITKYVFNHIGRNISASNLEHFLVSNKEIKVTKNTLLKYFDYLNKTFLTYRINYFDIKGKKILQTKFKYYATDLGILTINTNTDETYNLGYRLENLVLINLLEQQ